MRMTMLIDVLQQEATKIDTLVNVKKTVCMVFNPSQKPKIASHEFINFVLDGWKLEYVVMFKYLGHLLSSDLSDDADVKREIRNIYVCANTLRRSFGRCSQRVKAILYRAFCLCLYGSALWKKCTITVKNSFKYCYNGCMKIFFGIRKYDSVTNM